MKFETDTVYFVFPNGRTARARGRAVVNIQARALPSRRAHELLDEIGGYQRRIIQRYVVSDALESNGLCSNTPRGAQYGSKPWNTH